MVFDTATDDEFERVFLNIISLGSKDNTYKFAFARFLLDYSREHDDTETHVSFKTIAEYFLSYYWPQICKLKMKHAPQTTKKPVVVTIIKNEFKEQHYPDTYKRIKRKEPDKIKECISGIVKQCFHNVTWRFQKARISGATEIRLFYDYRIARTVNRNKKYVDLDYGIRLNPDAIRFFKNYNVILLKAVILEWSKFLEDLNIGMPKIIAKTDGRNMKRGSLTRYKKMLTPIFCECFYCERTLEKGRTTHVEHVIPFDYIAEDDIWNLTLACQECNLSKSGALPPMKYIEKLIERNSKYQGQITPLEKSLTNLAFQYDTDVEIRGMSEAEKARVHTKKFAVMIKNHYEGAKSHGYMELEDFPSVS